MTGEKLFVVRANHVAPRLGPLEILGGELFTEVDESPCDLTKIVQVVSAAARIFGGVVTGGDRPAFDRRFEAGIIVYQTKSGIAHQPDHPLEGGGGHSLGAVDLARAQRGIERVRSTYTWSSTAARYLKTLEQGIAAGDNDGPIEIPDLNSRERVIRYLESSAKQA